MKNPFLCFKKISVDQQDIPLEQILKKNKQMMDDLQTAYQYSTKKDGNELGRLLDHGSRLNNYKSWLTGRDWPKLLTGTLTLAQRVYDVSVQQVCKIQYSHTDIEELCNLMELSGKADFKLSAPFGVFVSALINTSERNSFELNLTGRAGLHLLGFRLKKAKKLLVIGDLGHFTGAGLQGGRIDIQGATGSWCGAEMAAGCIRISRDALSKTGVLMTGGRIQVDGQIVEISAQRSGGEIINRNKEYFDEQSG